MSDALDVKLEAKLIKDLEKKLKRDYLLCRGDNKNPRHLLPIWCFDFLIWIISPSSGPRDS